MSIEKVNAYYTSNKLVFASIEEAQVAELELIFKTELPSIDPQAANALASVLIQHSEDVVDILTMTPKRKPGRPLGKRKKDSAIKTAAEAVVNATANAAEPPAA